MALSRGALGIGSIEKAPCQRHVGQRIPGRSLNSLCTRNPANLLGSFHVVIHHLKILNQLGSSKVSKKPGWTPRRWDRQEQTDLARPPTCNLMRQLAGEQRGSWPVAFALLGTLAQHGLQRDTAGPIWGFKRRAQQPQDVLKRLSYARAR